MKRFSCACGRITKPDDQLALQEKLKQLKLSPPRAAAHASALPSSRARKDDTRRKILAGAILLAEVEAGDFDSRTVTRWPDQALVWEG